MDVARGYLKAEPLAAPTRGPGPNAANASALRQERKDVQRAGAEIFFLPLRDDAALRGLVYRRGRSPARSQKAVSAAA